MLRRRFFIDVSRRMRLAGAVFAVAFVTRGIHRVDPVAEHAPVGFRLIVLPGVAALWPLLAVPLVQGERPLMIRPLRRAHFQDLAGFGGGAVCRLRCRPVGAANQRRR